MDLGYEYGFTGEMRNFAVWDRVLSSSEAIGDLPTADALHNFDFADQSQPGVLINTTGNGDMTVYGDYAWIEGSVDIHEALQSDVIYDSSGADTLHISGAFGITDVSLEQDPNNVDNLLVKLVGSHVTTIENYFAAGAVEQLSFDDGSIYQMSALTITISGDSENNLLNGSAQNDVLNGYAGNDTLRGSDGSDYLYGGDGDDTLSGGSGVDMLYGQNGADTFVFDADSAFTNSNNIQDFSLSEGDKFDVSDLLSGYDPLADAITDFVQITESSGNSYLNVDTDGGADNFVQVAYLYNETGLTDEAALETSGNLITA